MMSSPPLDPARAFVDPADASWPIALAQGQADFYHLPAYVRLAASWEGGEPSAYLYSDGEHSMLLPLLLRAAPEAGVRDAVNPYGYPAPVFSEGAPDAFQREALEAFVADGAGEGLVATFLRLHPVLQPSLPAPAASDAWQVLDHGVTVTLQMDDDAEAWMASMKKGHRYEVRRLLRSGYTVRVNAEADWQPFCDVYLETMERIGAAESYRFTPDYFSRLRSALGDHLNWAAVLGPDGDVAAAGLFPVVDGLMQYHLSGTAAAHQSLSPTKLLIYEMREWGRQRGVRAFHLGGGVGGRRDSLFKFKAGFAGDVRPFRTARVLHDAGAYDRACAAWKDRHGAADFPDPDFFPLYRQRPQS